MTITKVYIVYYSLYGHVDIMAREVHKGAAAVEGVEATLWRVPEMLSDRILEKMKAPPKPDDIADIKPEQLPEADAFIFGFPSRFGMMPSQLKAFFDATGGLWASQALAGKPAGIFWSTGFYGGGQELSALTAITQLAHHGMLFVPLGYTFGSGMFELDEVKGGSAYGAGTFAGDGTRQPTELELQQAFYQEEQRRQELRGRPTLNMMIPMNVFEGSAKDHHGRGTGGESGDEALDEDTGGNKEVQVKVLVKRGNKQQTKQMSIPWNSSLVQSTKQKEAAELQEKEDIKRLILEYNDREEEELNGLGAQPTNWMQSGGNKAGGRGYTMEGTSGRSGGSRHRHHHNYTGSNIYYSRRR